MAACTFLFVSRTTASLRDSRSRPSPLTFKRVTVPPSSRGSTPEEEGEEGSTIACELPGAEKKPEAAADARERASAARRETEEMVEDVVSLSSPAAWGPACFFAPVAVFVVPFLLLLQLDADDAAG